MAQGSTIKLHTEDRLMRAEEMLLRRMQGLTYHEISREFRCKINTVREEIEYALEWRVSPNIELYRSLEDARLDGVVTKLEAIISAPEEYGVRIEHRLQAINSLIKVTELRSKLQGLFAPVKIEAQVQHEIDLSPDLQSLIEEARSRAAETRAGRVPGFLGS